MLSSSSGQDMASPTPEHEFESRTPHQEIRSDHKHVEHRTYTGPGCAVCGLPRSNHSTESELGEVAGSNPVV